MESLLENQEKKEEPSNQVGLVKLDIVAWSTQELQRRLTGWVPWVGLGLGFGLGIGLGIGFGLGMFWWNRFEFKSCREETETDIEEEE